jgi:hypothetical protein
MNSLLDKAIERSGKAREVRKIEANATPNK